MSEVIWKDIAGYEGFYKLSTAGHVLSCSREQINSLGIKRRLNPVVLKPKASGSHGTQCMTVNLSKDGEATTYTIGYLLLTTFRGPRPTPDHVAHNRSGDIENTALDNFEWTTRSYCRMVRYQDNRWVTPRISA